MPSYLTVQHKNRQHWIKDIKNQKLGHLTALRPTEQRKSNRVVWECVCDCENKTIVYRSTYQLKNTKASNLHCGCRDNIFGKLESGQIVNLTNKVFWRLTALHPTDERGADGSVMWKCQCGCDKKTIVFRSVESLKNSGKKQSCGCLLSEISTETNNNTFNYVDGTRIESIKDQKLLSNNKSGIRGVHFDSHAKKWRAVIYFQGNQIHLGLFTDIDDAAKARKKAEEEYFVPVIEDFEAKEKAKSDYKALSEKQCLTARLFNKGSDIIGKTIYMHDNYEGGDL